MLGKIEGAVLDAVGKPYLKRVVSKSLRGVSRAENAQNALWLKVRESLRGTHLFEDLNLGEVRSYSDYLARIAPRDYAFYAPYVDRIRNGEKNVLFKDNLIALIQTSGTTGFNDKLIPFNTSQLKVFQAFQTRCLGVVFENSGWDVSLSHSKLALGANPIVERTNGVSKGYVSGIVSTSTPKIFQKRVFPSAATLALENWDEKVSSILRETLNQDIRMLAAVPAHLVNLANDLLTITGKSSLIEIWPNLRTIVYSGTGIESYERTLNQLAGRKLEYVGLYIASEGPIGYEVPMINKRDSHEFVFAVNDMLLSFAEAENPNGRLLGVHELRAGVDYIVHTGSPNGLLQYCLRDVIRVTRTNPCVTFTIQGRQNQLLNIATEKVSMQQLTETIADVEAALGTSIAHFFVYPRQPAMGKAHYQWVVACDNENDTQKLANALDTCLMRASGDYQEERLIAKHIGDPQVRVLSVERISEYFAKNRHKGQFKMKTVFSTEAEFLHFANETFPGLEQQLH